MRRASCSSLRLRLGVMGQPQHHDAHMNVARLKETHAVHGLG